MNLLQVIIYGHSHPMTENEGRTMLGVWLILNALWLLSWGITALRWSVAKHRSEDWDGRLEIAFLIDICMIVLWLVIGLAYAGSYVGGLL